MPAFLGSLVLHKVKTEPTDISLDNFYQWRTTHHMDWFETLFGFPEGPYHWTQRQFIFRNGTLISRPNGRRLAVGQFSTPSLSDLRRLVRPKNRRNTLRHEVIGDILPLHAAPENAHATFQVACAFQLP